MKGIGFIILLISLVIAAVIGLKQRKTAVKMTTIAPSGKEVELKELPKEVKVELDNMNEQMEKRNSDAIGSE